VDSFTLLVSKCYWMNEFSKALPKLNKFVSLFWFIIDCIWLRYRVKSCLFVLFILDTKLGWAEDPIRDTDNAESRDGFMLFLNKFADKYIWPSVILITFVAIYSLISLFIVSIIGKADTAPKGYLSLAALSSNEECALKTSFGNASRDGILPWTRLICLYVFACFVKSSKHIKVS